MLARRRSRRKDDIDDRHSHRASEEVKDVEEGAGQALTLLGKGVGSY